MDVRRILFVVCVAGGLTVGALGSGAGPGFALATSLPRPAATGPGTEARVEVYPPSQDPTRTPSGWTPSPPVATPTGGVLPVTGSSGNGPLIKILAGAGAIVAGVGLVLLVRRRRRGPAGPPA